MSNTGIDTNQKATNFFVPSIVEQTQKGERVYDLFSRLLQDRVIFLIGTFDEVMANSIVAQLLWLEASDADEPINMYINSPGGNIDAMLAIFDTMQYIKCPVVTIGYGTVASAASFIVAAGDSGTRYALPNTEFMIHELSSGIQGKYTDLQNAHKHTKRLHEKLLNYYIEFTGQKKKKLQEDMKVDFYMTAEEAKNYGTKGLIDEIQEKSMR